MGESEKMRCPNCGAEYTELKSIKLISDKPNEFGRRMLTFHAEHENPVQWRDGKYYCTRCETIFTFQEGVKQESSKPIVQTKLSSIVQN